MSEGQMSEEQYKGQKVLAFWLFGTAMIVFAALTAYILLSNSRFSIVAA